MSEKKKFESGAVIFKEGAWEMSMYVIVSGKVGIYANYGTEKEQLLTELGEGKIFGEMGLIEARARSATAVALEDTELDIIDGDALGAYFKNEPEKVMEILINMTSRLRQLSNDYVDACDTISEYVAAGKQKKQSLWSKIANLISGGEEYGELYRNCLMLGIDPTRHFSDYYC